MMNESPKKAVRPTSSESRLAGTVGKKAARKIKAGRNATPGVWFGLGMMGLIGWSVTVPTLLGAALGHWLDQQQVGGRSWTLALLLAGLMIGCFNAWYWVVQEHEAMHDEDDHEDL